MVPLSEDIESTFKEVTDYQRWFGAVLIWIKHVEALLFNNEKKHLASECGGVQTDLNVLSCFTVMKDSHLSLHGYNVLRNKSANF